MMLILHTFTYSKSHPNPNEGIDICTTNSMIAIMGVTWCCDSSMAMNNHTTTWTSSALKLDDLLKTRRNFEECVKFPKRDIESWDESLTNRTSDHWNRLRYTKSEGKQILHMTINKRTWMNNLLHTSHLLYETQKLFFSMSWRLQE